MSPETKLRLVARQRGSLSQDATRAAVRWACAGPWGRPIEQSTDLDLWGALDEGAAVSAVSRASVPVAFRGPGFEVRVGSGRRRSSIGATLDSAPSAREVGDALAAWVRLLDNPEFAWASCDPDPGAWYHAEELPEAPPAFARHVRWLHVLIPGWSQRVDPGVVRDLAGCELHELSDGIAVLVVFDDPFRYDEPEIRAHRREVSERLRAAVLR